MIPRILCWWGSTQVFYRVRTPHTCLIQPPNSACRHFLLLADSHPGSTPGLCSHFHNEAGPSLLQSQSLAGSQSVSPSLSRTTEASGVSGFKLDINDLLMDKKQAKHAPRRVAYFLPAMPGSPAPHLQQHLPVRAN